MRSHALISGLGVVVLTALTCPVSRAQGHEQQQRAQQAQQQAQQRQQEAQQHQQQEAQQHQQQEAQQRQQQEAQRQQQAQQRQQEAQQRQQEQQQHAQQEQQQRAQQMQQAEQQRAQEMQQRAQQEQQNRAQQMQQRQQQEAHRQQEAMQRAQQMQQQNSQKVQERQQQEFQREQQKQQQVEQQRNQQAQQLNQFEQQRNQEAQQRNQFEQQRNQEAQQRNQFGQQRQRDMQQRAQNDAQARMQRDQQNQQDKMQRAQQMQQDHDQRMQQDQNRFQPGQPGHGIDRIQTPMKPFKFDKNLRRSPSLPPLKVQPIPLQKALPLPNFEAHASADQFQRAHMAQANMLRHLRAVPMSQAPRNWTRYRDQEMSNYWNNYRFNLNNRPYYINRQNTNYFPVQPSYYPSWYQPDPNWVYANGFTLANAINVGPSWLGYGWQPYYGEVPQGFICARDYFPTPWVYETMTGQWRQPGLFGYTTGPDYDYTGPITVEVIEQVFGPGGQVVNVPYLYNGFFYPDQGRWAYQNRQGYFIWLDL